MWLNHDHDLVDVRLTADGTSTAAAMGTMSAPRVVHTSGHGVLIGDDLNSAVHLRPARTTNPSGETIHTTENHPWLTADRGWIAAGQLQPGEAVVTLNGSSGGTVAWVHTVPGQADMYNLTVANDHTYAVGASQWVVHNTCTPGEYQNVKGHHIFAKKAFEGHPTYNLDTALSIGKDDLTNNNWFHQDMTTTQQRLFTQLGEDVANGVRRNTLSEHSWIAYQTLLAGGVGPAEAEDLVFGAYNDLLGKGVSYPTYIPWVGPNVGSFS